MRLEGEAEVTEMTSNVEGGTWRSGGETDYRWKYERRASR